MSKIKFTKSSITIDKILKSSNFAKEYFYHQHPEMIKIPAGKSGIEMTSIVSESLAIQKHHLVEPCKELIDVITKSNFCPSFDCFGRVIINYESIPRVVMENSIDKSDTMIINLDQIIKEDEIEKIIKEPSTSHMLIQTLRLTLMFTGMVILLKY
jgi:hypothetical protein